MRETIPIIDFSSINEPYSSLSSDAFFKISEELGDAMKTIGFAYIINHGVDMKKFDEIQFLSKQFFNLPLETKLKYTKKNPGESWHGYSCSGDEFLNENEGDTLELRESFDIWGFQQYDQEAFPKEMPGWKQAIDSFRPKCNDVTKKLLRCMGQYLKLENEEFFLQNHRYMDDPSIRSHAQYRTTNYFPVDPRDKRIPLDKVRCSEHTDWGSITLLLQDSVGGLEVQKLDGNWIEAVPIEDSIIVNIGQLMEIWTAGIFRATPHRVRILDEEKARTMARQSFTYFVNPDGMSEIKPIVECPPGNSKFLKQPPLNAYDHYVKGIEGIRKLY